MSITVVKKRVINIMSFVLAIPCADRIVLAADGKRTDYDDKAKALPDVPKIYQLTINSALLIVGNGLVDRLEEYMDDLVHTIEKANPIGEIVNNVKEIIDRRNWAEWKDDREKSHIEVVIAGYEGGEPKLYVIHDHKVTQIWGISLGNWDDGNDYYAANVNSDHHQNTKKQGNKVAIEMLSKAEAANPAEIGGTYLVWHVKPSGIEKLDDDDVAKLRARYR